jgi:hypothetical protein
MALILTAYRSDFTHFWFLDVGAPYAARKLRTQTKKAVSVIPTASINQLKVVSLSNH